MRQSFLRSLAVCTIAVAYACGGGEVSGPTSNTPNPAPAPVAAPQPEATPTPAAPAPAPSTGPAFTLVGSTPSTITVTYNGEASSATIETFYTSFDDQETPFGKQSHTVNRGDSVVRAFGQVCIQGDADQPGVKLIGGVFFDINGAPFNPSRNPEKVKECRDRCVPEWKELEPTYEPYVQAEQFSVSTVTQSECYRDQWKIIREQNTCTKEIREKSREKIRTNYEAPKLSITGSPALDSTGDTQGFTGQGTVLPTGGTFSPALPLLGNRPAYGQSPLVLSTTYTVTQQYGPEDLRCSVSASKTFSHTLDPQPPTCEQVNPPNYSVQSVQISWDQSGQDKNGVNSFNVNVRVFNQGNWRLVLEARPNSQSGWTLKDDAAKSLDCGKQNDLTVHENDHDWNRWRFRIERNGSTVFTSQEYVHP